MIVINSILSFNCIKVLSDRSSKKSLVTYGIGIDFDFDFKAQHLFELLNFQNNKNLLSIAERGIGIFRRE